MKRRIASQHPWLASPCMHGLMPCLLLCCLLCCLPGCARQKKLPPPTLQQVQVLHSATLQLPDNARIIPEVYILLRNQTAAANSLAPCLAQAVHNRGYAVSTSPSRAGYVLQCNIVFAGQLNPGAAARAVPLGYGKPVSGIGGDESVLMADIILVARNVPEPKTRKHGNSLTYGTRRSKLDGHHLRLAACVRQTNFATSQDLLEQALCQAVADILPPMR